MELNMVGAYGPFLDKLIAANDPPLLSYRRPEFREVDAWRAKARAKALELIALPEVGGPPQVEVTSHNVVDGVAVERLRWQLPYGPPTDAVFLKPRGARGRLPGVVALHDHGGLKYFGWRKIADDGSPLHPMLRGHRDQCYGGVAWANELAKLGYAVLCHDAFPFASRRVRVSDVSPHIRWDNAADVTEKEEERAVNSYNQWAAKHESIWAKSLASAATTWPGLFLRDDMCAVDVLSARPEVDSSRIGCCGLSGGGCRAVYLAGLDERVGCGICVGMMTTWRDYGLYKAGNHTWMVWTPVLAKYLDYPEIMALRLPKPTMVLNDEEDDLFSLPEMHRADDIFRQVYAKAGASERYSCRFYPGPHKFDLEMQSFAFSWFGRWLKEGG